MHAENGVDKIDFFSTDQYEGLHTKEYADFYLDPSKMPFKYRGLNFSALKSPQDVMDKKDIILPPEHNSITQTL